MDYDIGTFIDEWVNDDVTCLELYDTQGHKSLYKGHILNLPFEFNNWRLVSVSLYEGYLVLNCKPWNNE